MYFLDHVNSEVSKSADISEAQSLRRAVIEELRVSDSSYDLLISESRRLKTNIQPQIGERMSREERMEEINSMQTRLIQSLSPKDYAAFRDFTNTFIRKGVTTYRFKVGLR